MSKQRQSRSRWRPARLIATVLGPLALALAVSCPPAAADPFALGAQLPAVAGDAVSYIINGQLASIQQFPWQVYVLTQKGSDVAACGGAILSSTTVITAAHCVSHEHSSIAYPGEDTLIIAGASEVSLKEGTVSPSTRQEVRVETTTVDPLYQSEPVKDDVAVLTLSKGLALAPGLGTAAIPLVAAGATPPAGTALTVSGYGREYGAETPENEPTGKFYSTALTALSSDACRKEVGVNSAVLLCGISQTSATCDGDSGSPLIEGNPAVLVGLVDTGDVGCPVGSADVFTNLAAPEIRDFIEGDAKIPIAPRASTLPSIKFSGSQPVDFSPLTCEPGTWSGSPTFTYTFALENAAGGKTLQSGPSNLFTPTRSDVGEPLVCIVQASNAGGVSTERSSTTAPVQPDASPPKSAIPDPPKCHLHRCTIVITASDPEGVAVSLEASASYVTTCTPAPGTARPVCRTATVPMTISSQPSGAYEASSEGLPYGEKIHFRVLATNAAGLAQAMPAVRTVTLH